MRRWVIVFLLLVVPIQLVWGAAAPYCAHEAKAGSTNHFGHHEHRHQGSDLTSSAADEAGGGSIASHVDCESCHLGTSATLPTQSICIAALPLGTVLTEHGLRFQSHVPSGPERPDRTDLTAAARFVGGVACDRLQG
jgi:hypothetical protein